MEAVIQSCLEMLVPLVRAVVLQRLDMARNFRRVGYERTRIAFGTEILSRIKTESAPSAEDAGVLPRPDSSMCLGAILKEMNCCLFTERHPTLHLADPSVQVNQQHRLRLRH